MTGSKKANHIYFRDNYAYISFSFGIVVLDLDKHEIKDTYSISENGSNYEIYALVADDNYFYAGTSKGLFKANINDPFLVSSSHWKRDYSIPNSNSKFTVLGVFNNKIIANSAGNNDNNDSIYYLNNNSWTLFLANQHYTRKEIRQFNQTLLVTSKYHIFAVNANFDMVWAFNYYGFDFVAGCSAIMDEEENIWVADENSGLVKKDAHANNYTKYSPQGPRTENVWKMIFRNEALYVIAGGLDPSWNNLFIRGDLFTFQNEIWTNFHDSNTWDYTAITTDPSDPQTLYIGTWGKGVLVFKNNQITAQFDDNNSTLQTNIAGQPYVRIGGLIFDKDKNLWITNSDVGSPISVRKADGSWKAFPWGPTFNSAVIGNIHIDVNGRFWVVNPRWRGLIVFDVNGTIDNLDDDKVITFHPKNIFGEVINDVFCVTSDHDGYVWVGTEQGPILYTNPIDILNGETNGQQITIPRNDGTDIVDALLGAESVNCIVVDGANRKWLGTEKGGAFLVSPDGTKQILHFNTDNSPLFSNSVKTIAINDKTGEVFFGTDKGIISYRAVATQANDDFTNVYVYPNPVRENYNGNIIITGLIENATIKITDISGNLVYETKSLGGQAIWNGKTHNNRKVSTGVYLVFCTNDDGTKTYVTKFLVIN